jgi:hypothetical protein
MVQWRIRFREFVRGFWRDLSRRHNVQPHPNWEAVLELFGRITCVFAMDLDST